MCFYVYVSSANQQQSRSSMVTSFVVRYHRWPLDHRSFYLQPLLRLLLALKAQHYGLPSDRGDLQLVLLLLGLLFFVDHRAAQQAHVQQGGLLLGALVALTGQAKCVRITGVTAMLLCLTFDPPSGDAPWWHTAVSPTGRATSSSRGRRRSERPSSARWRPLPTATGAALTSLCSLPPRRKTHTSCWQPRRHLEAEKKKSF